MRLKSSVKCIALRPELTLALIVVDGVYRRHGTECVVTSLNDSKHSKTSLHYSGAAADIRTRTLPAHLRQTVRDEISTRLTTDYDVILESDHIHIEYQPRRKD